MLDSLEEAFGDVESWFRNARHLHAAAVQLVEGIPELKEGPIDDFRIGALKGSLLLLGFSAENALKGAIVAENALSIKNGRIEIELLFGNGAEQHNLVALHEKTGKNFPSADLTLLVKLTAIIRWAGRYPAPIKGVDFQSASKLNPRNLIVPIDIEQVLQLIEDCEGAARTGKTNGRF